MDKNKFYIGLIVFIVVFGGVIAIKSFSTKSALTVIGPDQTLPETVAPIVEEQPSETTNPTVSAHPLLNTTWVWQKTTYLNGTETIAPAGKFVITFKDDMTLSSTTDCNGIFSKFIIDDEILSIGPIGATEMACAGETLETLYTQELGRTASHVIKGKELRLILWKDAGVMVFNEAL